VEKSRLETWRRRSLGGQKFPYLVVDAHYEKVRREGRVLSTAVLWVIGISETQWEIRAPGADWDY